MPPDAAVCHGESCSEDPRPILPTAIDEVALRRHDRLEAPRKDSWSSRQTFQILFLEAPPTPYPGRRRTATTY